MHGISRVRWGAVVLVGFGIVLRGGLEMDVNGPVAHAAGQEERLLSDGVYSEAQASRGRRVYRQACASCHAAELEGGEMGPGLRGQPFLELWEGESLGELMALVQQSMPQDNPGGLSEDDYVDVLAFMIAANDFPSGDIDLTLEGMGDIVIVTNEE